MTTDHNREVEGERNKLIVRLARIHSEYWKEWIAAIAADAIIMLRTDLTELETLRSANAALRADAERYRWLREYSYLHPFYIGGRCVGAHLFEEAIDAALATPNIEETPKGDGTP